MPGQLIFITESDSMKDAMSAAGISGTGITPVCPFNTGDFITFPEAPGLAYRVTKRLHASGTKGKAGDWYIFIESAPHPLG